MCVFRIHQHVVMQFPRKVTMVCLSLPHASGLLSLSLNADYIHPSINGVKKGPYLLGAQAWFFYAG